MPGLASGKLPSVGAGEAAAPTADKRFAAVLDAAESPRQTPLARPDTGRCPFNAPILELDAPTRPGLRAVEAPARSARAARPEPTPVQLRLEVAGERADKMPVRSTSPAAPEQASHGSAWIRLADDALKAESRIDAMIDAGRRGQAFSAGELLGLQMEVFRYSQTVEVISRTTDKLIGGLKQALGTQV